MRKAFTLTEVVIVAAIIGILAAIIIPEFQNYAQQAKETAAKDDLRIIRTAIERYTVEHNGIPPGYQDGDPGNLPGESHFYNQLITSNQYLLDFPENPFSGLSSVWVLKDDDEFPAEPTLYLDTYGWVYKPAIKTIRVYWPGTDSNGAAYFDY